MVQNGKDKDHETTFVPPVHPTTLDDLDLEAGCTGDKQNDKDKGARLKKVSILVGLFFCLLVLVCGICVSGTAESTSCVSLLKYLEAFMVTVGDLISSPDVRMPEALRAPDIFLRGQPIFLEMNTILGQGSTAVVFKAEMLTGQNGQRVDVAVKVPIISKGFPVAVIKECLHANDAVARKIFGRLNDPRLQHLCQVYGIAELPSGPGGQRLCKNVAASATQYAQKKQQEKNDGKRVRTIHPCAIYGRVVIMELCESDLTQHLQESRGHGQQQVVTKKPMSLLDVKKALLQLGHGLKLLHENGLAHRDVKPDNIVVRNNGGIFSYALADFDVMTAAVDWQPCHGTLAFFQPEAFDKINEEGLPVGKLHPRRHDYCGLMLSLASCAAPEDIRCYLGDSRTAGEKLQYVQDMVDSAFGGYDSGGGDFRNEFRKLVLQKVKGSETGKSLTGIFRHYVLAHDPDTWCESFGKFLLTISPMQTRRREEQMPEQQTAKPPTRLSESHRFAEQWTPSRVPANGEGASAFVSFVSPGPCNDPPSHGRGLLEESSPTPASASFNGLTAPSTSAVFPWSPSERHWTGAAARTPMNPAVTAPIHPAPSAPIHPAPTTQMHPAPTTQMHPAPTAPIQPGLCASAPAYGDGLGVYQHACASMYSRASARANVSIRMAYDALTQQAMLAQQQQQELRIQQVQMANQGAAVPALNNHACNYYYNVYRR